MPVRQKNTKKQTTRFLSKILKINKTKTLFSLRNIFFLWDILNNKLRRKQCSGLSTRKGKFLFNGPLRHHFRECRTFRPRTFRPETFGLRQSGHGRFGHEYFGHGRFGHSFLKRGKVKSCYCPPIKMTLMVFCTLDTKGCGWVQTEPNHTYTA